MLVTKPKTCMNQDFVAPVWKCGICFWTFRIIEVLWQRTFRLFIMDTLHKMHVPHIVSQWMRVEHGSNWKTCFERLNKLITISLVTRQHVVKEHWHVLIFWSEHLHQRFVLGGISNLQGRFHWQKLRSIACGNVSYRYLMLMVGRDHFILMHQIVSLLSETVSECDNIFLHFMQSRVPIKGCSSTWEKSSARILSFAWSRCCGFCFREVGLLPPQNRRKRSGKSELQPNLFLGETW